MRVSKPDINTDSIASNVDTNAGPTDVSASSACNVTTADPEKFLNAGARGVHTLSVPKDVSFILKPKS